MLDAVHKKLLTEIIKKQMVILGPFITLYKARNVKGLTIADDGTVLNAEGNPQDLIKNLINEYVALSGLIIEKAMEPLLLSFDLSKESNLPTKLNDNTRIT